MIREIYLIILYAFEHDSGGSLIWQLQWPEKAINWPEMEKAADFFRLDLVRRRCWRRACPNGNHLGTYGFTLTPKFADALWGVISGVIII